MNLTDFLGKTRRAKVDRPLSPRHPEHDFLYLLNYGYIPEIMAPDGEALDAYILGVFEPSTEFEGRCREQSVWTVKLPLLRKQFKS